MGKTAAFSRGAQRVRQVAADTFVENNKFTGYVVRRKGRPGADSDLLDEAAPQS